MHAAAGRMALQSRRQPIVCIRHLHRARPPPPTRPYDREEEKKKLLQNPRNEAIPYKFVRFVNPETKTLEPPASLSAVLARVDRKRQYLELVADHPEPIVKLIDSKDRYDRGRTRRVQQVLARAPEEKELQLTWGVGAGDLDVKLRKAREDLVDGNRVSLVFAPKKGQPVLSDEERTRAVDDALRLLEDVGRERKERTVQGLAVALHLEPLRQKQVHELGWAYAAGGDPFKGVGNVVSALKSGVRVDAVFVLPPPPKKLKNDPTIADKVVAADTVQGALEETIAKLEVFGRQWRPMESRKNNVLVRLEPRTDQSTEPSS